jgi:transketolase
LRKEFERLLNKELPFPWAEEVAHLKKEFAESKPKQATRKSSQVVLEKLTAKIPELIGGSADLTGSNNTKTAVTPGVSAENFAGRYIHYGVREHAMAAVMNGMALHGEFIPYGGTFLVFADYCRPSIRLAALMKQRVIFVMTHDSIGLGEDGPTHQPVEHLASLRAIPGLDVYRPADAAETAECWALAIARQDGPSLIALSRQDLPTVRNEYTAENKCSLGGYILKESSLSDGHEPKVALISSGSEVEIVLKAQEILEDKGIPTRVVSMPCTQLFEHQGEGYRRNVLGDSTLRVAVEAASQMGWDRYIGKYGIFIGMNDFGASAPAGDLYKHFGITAERIVEEVLERV